MALGNFFVSFCVFFSVILMQSKVRIKCTVCRAHKHFLFYSVASVFSLGQVGVRVLPVGKVEANRVAWETQPSPSGLILVWS